MEVDLVPLEEAVLHVSESAWEVGFPPFLAVLSLRSALQHMPPAGFHTEINSDRPTGERPNVGV